MGFNNNTRLPTTSFESNDLIKTNEILLELENSALEPTISLLMNNIQNSFNIPEVSLDSLIWNLLLCTVLSSIICWHFNARAQKRFLRRDLGLVLPVICLTTLLVISVVKSSLALSLGLVGALSIVRFRTPIKEPEELAYIFLAIAIGLALGADQREVAATALPIILIVISLIDRLRPSFTKTAGNLLLTVEVEKSNATDSVLSMIQSIAPEANVRRIDQNENLFSVAALIKINDTSTISKFSEEFEREFPQGNFSILMTLPSPTTKK